MLSHLAGAMNIRKEVKLMGLTTQGGEKIAEGSSEISPLLKRVGHSALALLSAG